MLIKIDITKKHPTVDGTPLIVCGNSGYRIQFTFDEEWADLEYKTARFVFWKAGKAHYIDVPFSGDTVDAPVLSGISYVLVGVYTDFLRTSTPAKIPCEYSIRCNPGENEEAPTPELYDQLIELFNRVDQLQQEAIKSAASAAEANAEAQEAAAAASEAVGSVVSRVKESNAGRWVSFWVGTQEQYNKITEKVENCMYIITDDPTSEELVAAMAEMTEKCEASAEAADQAKDAAAAAASRVETAAAEAKAAANAAAGASEATKTAMMAVDISDKITLSLLTAGASSKMATFEVTSKKYRYSPMLGVVFFELTVMGMATGGLVNGDTLTIKQDGKYKPVTNGYTFSPIPNIDERMCGVKHCISDEAICIDITFREDIAMVFQTTASGWYFCNGEE